MILQVKQYLSRFALAQAVAALISLPFLTAWGLPLSVMMFFGNLLLWEAIFRLFSGVANSQSYRHSLRL